VKKIIEQPPNYQYFDVTMQPKLAPLLFLTRCTYLLSLGNHVLEKDFCKIKVRHTLKRKNWFFDFFFSNNKLLSNKKLANYLRKSKKLIFLNNICLTSILQNFN
jgi:hypothetical protein